MRGGEKEGVVSATGPRYGYEACNAHYYETLILEDSEIYMTFQWPLQFLDDDDCTAKTAYEETHYDSLNLCPASQTRNVTG